MPIAEHWRHPRIIAEPIRKMRACINCRTPFRITRGGRKRCIPCADKKRLARCAGKRKASEETSS